MSKFLTFSSTNPPFVVSDLSKVVLIREELKKIVKHQQALDITRADIGLDDLLEEVIGLLDNYLDYDPTDDIDPFPVTSHEMWQNAHEQHIALHS
jgi:hypothetical protein